MYRLHESASEASHTHPCHMDARERPQYCCLSAAALRLEKVRNFRSAGDCHLPCFPIGRRRPCVSSNMVARDPSGLYRCVFEIEKKMPSLANQCRCIRARLYSSYKRGQAHEEAGIETICGVSSEREARSLSLLLHRGWSKNADLRPQATDALSKAGSKLEFPAPHEAVNVEHVTGRSDFMQAR